MINVIIVEDDPMVAEFNRRYVELIDGFQVIKTLHLAEEAFLLLAEEKVDLILLDIFMPGTNGLDFLVRLRQAAKDVGVIIVSAACDGQSIKKALQFGAVDYVIKPFEFERLQTALLTYKKLSYLADDHQLSQSDLDDYMSIQAVTNEIQVPKGIDRHTLITAWEEIKKFSTTAFSTEELAQAVGVSRVSMRKYLDFLRQIGVLKLELIYGTVGRPIYKYRCNTAGNQIIRPYLA